MSVDRVMISRSVGLRAYLAAGARFPARLLRALDRAGKDGDAIERVGIHYATQQCLELLENEVSGIHFYTLNKSHATREIYANLGIERHRRARVTASGEIKDLTR